MGPSLETFATRPLSGEGALVASAGGNFQPTLDVGSSPSNVPNARLAAAIADYNFDRTVSRSFESNVPWSEVVEFLDKSTGKGVLFEAVGRRANSLLAAGDDYMLVVERDTWGDWDATIAATDRSIIDQWMQALATFLPPPPPPPPPAPLPYNMVPVTFWMQNPVTGGAMARYRDIEIHEWEGVAANYPGELSTQLGALMAMDDPSGGKLITFHGPPGTGKTRAILTLISEWRTWCHASVVTDAEKFFGDAAYLNDLVFGSEGMRDWLLLVIEDGDEFMNVAARDTKGQAISRLLNVNDGIIGQGLNLLTLISTNVATEDLNPAVTRTGRCMADLHFGGFSPADAVAWLGARGIEHDGAFGEGVDEVSLADLYRLAEIAAAP